MSSEKVTKGSGGSRQRGNFRPFQLFLSLSEKENIRFYLDFFFFFWQPTRLPRPWDSPGKNTGVGCHFLLQFTQIFWKIIFMEISKYMKSRENSEHTSTHHAVSTLSVHDQSYFICIFHTILMDCFEVDPRHLPISPLNVFAHKHALEILQV